jgi:antitoxin FitA
MVVRRCAVPTITVKNIPPEMYERLKELAKANRRSMNSEILLCIERVLGSRRRDIEGILERARQLRELTASHPISDEEMTRAIEEGRP